MFKMRVTAILLVILSSASAHARLNPESFYQDEFCYTNMLTEVRMPDGTRADCISIGIVIEVDFADKWFNGVGQVLGYAHQTGLNPIILLIMESSKDCKHLARLEAVVGTTEPKILVIETGPYKGLCVK